MGNSGFNQCDKATHINAWKLICRQIIAYEFVVGLLPSHLNSTKKESCFSADQRRKRDSMLRSGSLSP